MRKAIQQLGLHSNTIRKYADEGKIKTIKNEAGQRLYDVQSYVNSATRASTVCYCRVSSTKQRDDLEGQVAYMRSLYPEAEIIRDIEGGINFKRKGLQTLLDRCLQGNKLTIIVAHRNRLARFGFDLIRYLVEQNGRQVVVQGSTAYSPETEFTADLLSILHVFSCRMHGLRKYSNKKIKEDPHLSNSSTETSD